MKETISQLAGAIEYTDCISIPLHAPVNSGPE